MRHEFEEVLSRMVHALAEKAVRAGRADTAPAALDARAVAIGEMYPIIGGYMADVAVSRELQSSTPVSRRRSGSTFTIYVTTGLAQPDHRRSHVRRDQAAQLNLGRI